MKKVLMAGGVLVVVGIVAVLVLGSNLGKLVKAGIEQFGPKFTGTSVTVESVDLSPSSGAGAIKGLVVGNPEGYKTPYAIRLGSAAIAVDAGTVLKDKVVIKSIQVTDPEINIEGGISDNNLKKIMANLDSFTAGETSQPAAPATGGGNTKKLEVDDFVLSGAKVNVKFALLGGGGPSITLPDIHLTNLGSGPDGITPGALTKQIIGEITSKTLSAVTTQVSNLGKGALDAAKGVGSGAAEGVKKLGDMFKKK